MDMNASFDQVLFAAMLSTQPPAIARPFFEAPTPNDEAFVQSLEALWDAAERELATIEKQIVDELRKFELNLRPFLEQDGTLSTERVQSLSAAAEALERDAGRQGTKARRNHKRKVRMAKDANLSAPLYSRAMKVFARNDQLYRRELELRLDTAMFYRALAAKYDPDRVVHRGRSMSDMNLSEFLADA